MYIGSRQLRDLAVQAFCVIGDKREGFRLHSAARLVLNVRHEKVLPNHGVIRKGGVDAALLKTYFFLPLRVARSRGSVIKHLDHGNWAQDACKVWYVVWIVMSLVFHQEEKRTRYE
jgi:hypothetical protein